MSRFYGEIQGNRGKASRMGSEKSGMWAHVRGWNLGVRVQLLVDEDGNDCIVVWRTGGSNGRTVDKLIATLSDVKEEA